MFGINRIWKLKKMLLVVINFTANGIEFSAISTKGNKKTSLSFDDLASLIKHFGKEKAYHIHASGNGVLTRMVDNIPNYKEQLIVNGDKDDFYFSSIEFGSKLITSFFRKSLLDEVLTLLEQQKVFLLNVTSGISPLLLSEETNFEVKYDYEVSIKNGEIFRFEKHNQTPSNGFYQGQLIDLNEALYEGVLRTYQLKQTHFNGGLTDEVKTEKLQQFNDYRQFKFIGVSAVSFILLLLLANYFFLNNLNQKVADLELNLALNNENISLLDRLEQEKTRKEQLILTSGINSKSFTSFYIDRIGKSVPSSIKLKEMYVFPLKEKLKQKRKVDISQDIIEIIGYTPNSYTMDDWMEKMNRFDWVNKVELVAYNKNSEQQAEFKLIVSLAK